MLRAARSGEELVYGPVAGATRHGAQPPKLPKLARHLPDGLPRYARADASPRARARRLGWLL